MDNQRLSMHQGEHTSRIRVAEGNSDMYYRSRFFKSARINLPGFTASASYGIIVAPSWKDSGVYAEVTYGGAANWNDGPLDWRKGLTSGVPISFGPNVAVDYGKAQSNLISTSTSGKVFVPFATLTPPKEDNSFSISVSPSMHFGVREEFVLREEFTPRTLKTTADEIENELEEWYNDALGQLGVPNPDRPF